MMTERRITEEMLEGFGRYLVNRERSSGTIDKYLRDVNHLASWTTSREEACELTKESAGQWKNALLESGRAIATVNSMLAAANSFFKYMGWDDCCLKAVKLQKKFFRENERELTKGEYQRLLRTAIKRGNERLALLMETMCATGIRVSEVKYITTEAVKTGRARIYMKGKCRTVLIPGQLRKKLRRFAERRVPSEGEIFVTKQGKSLGRKRIWAEMKALCVFAGVSEKKVFPHNLRHLFARCFYEMFHDIAGLADVLGHSSVETTRIYLVSTEKEHIKKIAQLQLVL